MARTCPQCYSTEFVELDASEPTPGSDDDFWSFTYKCKDCGCTWEEQWTFKVKVIEDGDSIIHPQI